MLIGFSLLQQSEEYSAEVPMEITCSERGKDDKYLYWVLKKAVAYHVRSEVDNEHTIFIENLLALYGMQGTHEILEQAWAYALAHLYQGGKREAVDQLSPKHRQAIRLRYFLDAEVLNGSSEVMVL